MFSEQASRELEEVVEPVSRRMQILVDGKEEKGIRLFTFQIEFKSEKPLRPEDFDGPIKAHIPDNRKLLGVQKTENAKRPFRLDKTTEKLVRDERQPVEFELSIVDQHNFQIKPILMNPGEWLSIDVYTAAMDPSNYAPLSDELERYKEREGEIKWTCHIASVECPGHFDFERDSDPSINQPAFLQVAIQHVGWSVYAIVLFAVVDLLALTLLGKRGGFSRFPTYVQLISFSIAITLSICSGEILADSIFPYRMFGMRIYDGQPMYAWVILVLNGVVLAALVVMPTFKRISSSKMENK